MLSALPERGCDSGDGILGDVLIEGTWLRASHEDALYGLVLEGTV